MNVCKQSGCKGCTERRPGCHSTCERYAEFVRLNKELNKKRKEQESASFGWRRYVDGGGALPRKTGRRS